MYPPRVTTLHICYRSVISEEALEWSSEHVYSLFEQVNSHPSHALSPSLSDATSLHLFMLCGEIDVTLNLKIEDEVIG